MLIISVQKEGDAVWVKLQSVGKSSLRRRDSVKRSFLSTFHSPINLSPPPLTASNQNHSQLYILWTQFAINAFVENTRVMYVLQLAGGWGWIGCVFVGGEREDGAGSKWYKSVEIAQFLPATQNKRECNRTWTVDGEL